MTQEPGHMDQQSGRLLWIFIRGALIVGLIALNTRFLAARAVPPAMLTSAVIGLVWWENTKRVQTAHPMARWCYAAGGSVGTLLACLLS